MTTLVEFETATLADVMKRLAQIAPKTGSAFDKASGIIIEINPLDDSPVCARSTNLAVFFMEWVGIVQCSGDPVTWRLPAGLLSSIVMKLPTGSGKTVTFEQDDTKQINVKCGRTKARLSPIVHSDYPMWDVIDTEGMGTVSSLGARIEQVSWAIGKEEPYSGVYLDGDSLVATNRNAVAVVPCEANSLLRPITVPLKILAPIVRQMGDTQVGIVDNQLVLVPNEYSQIKTTIYDANIPPITKFQEMEFDSQLLVEKDAIVACVDRVTTMNDGDRMAEVRLYIGSEEIAFFVAATDGTDDIEDAVELPGQADHEVIEIGIAPDLLLKALQSAPNPQVLIKYNNVPRSQSKILHIDGGSGYLSWIALRRAVTQG